ncbi:undecaprenyldiphospho-muramoylpentapeptide beta-N-acetylglucosaminyltransferase [Tessaracoccus sp. OS52]|uniref:undecaprenyldiphospho-muramoylpentapeptide beta-N-acetylglucosaminyltransferase n=1 Tax=Tessaracoccus sp. OS52 TaxID=2886691 RepID=UPI001D0FD569|nr:undecaprenyldiphospho-muramoylpentapeptide beta-N-acetylglucosaminyltransferase [Tessaracoccus sp. OS52]MCC2593385.1 undecaprenyldiphospho-muramoylpentapeptide beta-N-acetylglucosaminyltransferase [Tessaracoccus sp. OS52]
MTSVVLAGGGTAGHTSPLIATARALQALEPGVELVCIGTRKGLETRVIPAAGLRLEFVTPVPLSRKLDLDLVRLPWTLTRSVLEARRILRAAKAEALVGFGGYVSIPAYLAARTMGVPVVLHEANKIAGISNRIGARFAAYVATTFAETELPGSELIGMPMSASVTQPRVGRAEARREFGLDEDRPTLLVSGGSQGAVSINQAVTGALEELLGAGIQVLHVLGPKNFVEGTGVREHVSGAKYVPVAFVEDMARAYAAADLMVARAGAATVMETAVSGLPVVFVPLPWGNGEQARNAAELVAADAGILLPESELSAVKLAASVVPLITDPERLSRMSARAREQYPADAAEVLARAVLEVSTAKEAS